MLPVLAAEDNILILAYYSTTAQAGASGHSQGAGGKENIQGDSGGNDGSTDHRQEESLGTKPRTSVLPPGPPPQAVLGTGQFDCFLALS